MTSIEVDIITGVKDLTRKVELKYLIMSSKIRDEHCYSIISTSVK